MTKADQVFQAIKDGQPTSRAVARKLGWPPNVVSTYISKLVKSGRVKLIAHIQYQNVDRKIPVYKAVEEIAA